MNAKQAREVFRYEDGKVYWRIKPANWIDPGDEAGGPLNGPGRRYRGRWFVHYKGKSTARNRLVWMLHHGEIPDGLVIDHINNDCTDDRIEDLQAVTPRLNRVKEIKPRDLPTGVQRHRNRFVANAYINGKRKYLGIYATPEEASAAYQQAICVSEP